MDEIRYIKMDNDVLIDGDYLQQLVSLSKEWELEHSCPSYNANDEGYYKEKELFVALLGTTIVGYALGEIKALKEKTSYNQIGESSFELDELFVTKRYRNQRIGHQLFDFLEQCLKDKVEVIGVIATSFSYEKLLNFYVKELGMDFNHALLVKRTDS